MSGNEQQVQQLISEVERTLRTVTFMGPLTEDQAVRLFDICTEIAEANVCDATKKSFFCTLYDASSRSQNPLSKIVYFNLATEFRIACSPLLDNVTLETTHHLSSVSCSAG